MPLTCPRRGRPSAPIDWGRSAPVRKITAVGPDGVLKRQGLAICFRRIGFRMNIAAPATSRFMMVATTNTECQEPV
jgi:hypothetical protein